MRRFVLLISFVVLMDTALYSALTPLLPHYADQFGISRTAAGVLLACYGCGVLVAALPAGVLVSRLGPKRVVLGGLVLVGAASLAFAFADDPWLLGVTRALQGVGSAATWAGGLTWLVAVTPADRRGRTIGTAMGAAVLGALVGPVLGAIADFAGARATFCGFAAIVTAAFVLTAREPDAAAEPQRLRDAAPAFRDRRLLVGLWVTLLPALLFGAYSLGVSFRLHDAGWRTSAIAVVFLAAAGLETVMNPLLGRVVDRRGHLAPIRIACVLSVGFALALAWTRSPAALVPLALVAALAFGAFYAPGMAMISTAAEGAGLSQALAWGVMNGAWAAGNVIGPAAAGALSQAVSDATPWLVVAALAAVTVGVLQLRGAKAALAGAATLGAALALAGAAVAAPAGSSTGGGGRWQPVPGLSWQVQLSGTYDPKVAADVVEVDGADTPDATVVAIGAAGRKAVCYVAAGSWESWRTDAKRFPRAVLGKGLDGWPGERWLDIRRLDVLVPLLRARVASCAAKGFAGVDFDNVDGYANATGFPLTAADQLRFNRWLAAEAHRQGLAVGLKNDLGQVAQLVASFDWATNEQCVAYEECDLLTPFVAAHKPVVVIEYDTPLAQVCAVTQPLGFAAMRKRLALGAWRQECPR